MKIKTNSFIVETHFDRLQIKNSQPNGVRVEPEQIPNLLLQNQLPTHLKLKLQPQLQPQLQAKPPLDWLLKIAFPLQFSCPDRFTLFRWLLFGLATLGSADPSGAQLIPDNTLPTPSSVTIDTISPTSPNSDPTTASPTLAPTTLERYTIEGGTQSGENLFHSFEQFDLPTEAIANFLTPNGTGASNADLAVRNIITRITGGQLSTIDGTLTTNGTANLFLLAPAGIVFGNNAKLDLNGGFYASAADALTFADGTRLDAQPTRPLLTISAPIGFAFAANNLTSAATLGAITVQASSLNADRGDGLGEQPGLTVVPGQTLALIGRQLLIDGGELQARGGQVALMGVNQGTVTLSADGTIVPLFSAQDQEAQNLGELLGNLQFSNTATVNVRSGSGGNIAIAARDLTLDGGSRLRAGIETDLGAPDAVGGAIQIQAGTVRLAGESFISNSVNSRAIGTAGDITINANQVAVAEDSFIGADVLGQGRAGLVTIHADRLNVAENGAIRGILFPGAIGQGGSLQLTAPELQVTQGGRLTVTTGGEGNAGNVTIISRDLNLSGESDFQVSGIFSAVDSQGTGNGGTIAIQTNTLNVQNGARINAETFGQGNAGRIDINASGAVTFSGVRGNLFADVLDVPSAASISVRPGAVGNGGQLNLTAATLTLRNGGRLLAGTLGTGSSGEMNLNVSDRLWITGRQDGLPSGIFATAGVGAIGNGGLLNLTAGNLQLDNGGLILSSAIAWAEGNAGNINIRANQITIDPQQTIPVQPDFNDLNALGNLGNSLSGLPDVNISTTSGRLTFLTGIFSTTQGSAIGNSGTISLRANRLDLRNNAIISVSNLGFGGAGEINLDVDQINLDRSLILANTLGFSPNANGDLANINMRANGLTLTDHSAIATDAEGFSSGGNITLKTGTLVALDNSDITANALTSLGGRVVVNAQGIFGTEFRDRLTPLSDITATSALGAAFAGIVEFQTPDIDSTTGLVRLDTTLIDVTALLDQDLCARDERGELVSQFVILGRGGLPLQPEFDHPNITGLDWASLPNFSPDLAQGLAPNLTPDLTQSLAQDLAPNSSMNAAINSDENVNETMNNSSTDHISTASPAISPAIPASTDRSPVLGCIVIPQN